MEELYETDRSSALSATLAPPRRSWVPSLSSADVVFRAFTGAGLLRRDPPDRYVFNIGSATPRRRMLWYANL